VGTTSGYSINSEKGSFYPEKLTTKEMLQFLSQAISLRVEINHSFLSNATENCSAVGENCARGFAFALKAKPANHSLKGPQL